VAGRAPTSYDQSVHSHEKVAREDEQSVRERPERSLDRPQETLLDLQQMSGNAGIARLLQRKDRPASTDVADTEGGGKHGDKPPPAKAVADIHARVIKYDIDDGKTLITIASGLDQGVKVGMSGSLVQPNGKEIADFTIEQSEGRISKAHVQAIPDQVRAAEGVVIKASSFHDENAGKEF
jgi:hypothetical protein